MVWSVLLLAAVLLGVGVWLAAAVVVLIRCCGRRG
jgi:hypothetical protein